MKYDDFKKKRLSELNEKQRMFDDEINLKINRKKGSIRGIEDEIKESEGELNQSEKKVDRWEDENSFLNKIKGLFKGDKSVEQDFSLNLTPQERVAYEKAIKKMKGGSSNISYDLTLEEKDNLCKRIEGEKNLYKDQLDMVNHCFD